MGDRRARVIAAYATVKIMDAASGKPTVCGFYEGAILPPSADPQNVEGLVRRGYVEWVEEPEQPADPEPKADDKAETAKKAAPAKKAG